MNGRPLHLTIAALLSVATSLSNVGAANSSPSLSQATATPSPTVKASPTNSPTPIPSSPTNNPAKEALVTRDIPGIRGKISIPSDWTFLPGKLLEGDVLLAVREKITSENDPWNTGLSMTIDRNGAKDSGMKAGDYALGIAREAREKAGEEASPISDSTTGAYREIRFEFPVQTDSPLLVTEVLRANDQTGTVAVILWQSAKAEAPALRDLREAVLSGIVLDPAQ
jgi:hypothetical protein